MSGDRAAMAKFTTTDLEKILGATLSGMTTEQFTADVKQWLATAKHPRWKRPYTELIYQPMLEVMQYLRANGYKTYIVTGGGQDFVRVYAEQVYGVPPEQVVGTARRIRSTATKRMASPMLIKQPKLLFNDNNCRQARGNSLDDRPASARGLRQYDRRSQMLEYTQAGDGARLMMLVLHDDAEREYAYGPADGLPDTKIGTFGQSLYDEAKKNGWTVISMKTDWKRVFGFEK